MAYYRYGYLLVISDEEGMRSKFDYLITNEILFNNSAIYNDLSGIDLCRYDLFDDEEYKDFFEAIDDMQWDPTVEQTFVLMDLATELKEFLEV